MFQKGRLKITVSKILKVCIIFSVRIDGIIDGQLTAMYQSHLLINFQKLQTALYEINSPCLNFTQVCVSSFGAFAKCKVVFGLADVLSAVITEWLRQWMDDCGDSSLSPLETFMMLHSAEMPHCL